MAGFYLIRDGQELGPVAGEELQRLKVAPADLVRYGDDGSWLGLSSLVARDVAARTALADSIEPDQPPLEAWAQRNLVEYTWPAMLLVIDGLWLLLAGLRYGTNAGWVTAFSLLVVMGIAIAGLLRRAPWAWNLAALVFGAMGTWMLAPLLSHPSPSFALWCGINVSSAAVLLVRRPRGTALDWPWPQRRLLLMFSSDLQEETRPLSRTGRGARPLQLIAALLLFYLVGGMGVFLFHRVRYPDLHIPLSLVPWGSDVLSRLVALVVYLWMVGVAVVLAKAGAGRWSRLGLQVGHGWRRAFWTGFRLSLALFVVLLASRWVMRSAEAIEQRWQGPERVESSETQAGQVRTAVEQTLERRRVAGVWSWRTLWLLMVALLIGPLCEEIFFRGLVFGSLRRVWPFWAAALVSSFVFAASHGWGASWGAAAPVLWFQIAAGGVAAAYAYELTGTLIAPMTLHALWNGGQTVLEIVFSS